MIEDPGNISIGQTKIRNTKTSQRSWLDVVLFGMEILAAVGLVAIVANGLSLLGVLNQTVAIALQQPLSEPTPIVREVVLPDGHTPPNGLGGASMSPIRRDTK